MINKKKKKIYTLTFRATIPLDCCSKLKCVDFLISTVHSKDRRFKM